MAVLTDAPTRRRSYITFPEYRMGTEPPNKGMKLPPEPLTQAEVQQLLTVCGRGAAGIRNRALIVLMWRSGLRVGEAVALYPKDVDLDLGTVSVLSGKGRKRRTIGVDPHALTYIERWLEYRERPAEQGGLGITRHKPLFCTISRDGWGPIGRPIKTSYVRQMCKRVGRNADIDKRVHPHGFRHTHAFELSMENVPIDMIKRQLGHSSIATTAHYIDHLAPAAVVEAIRARSWAE